MHSLGNYSYDDSNWPLLIAHLDGMPTRQEYEAYLARSTDYLHRGEPHVILVDLSRSGVVSAELRRLQAEWLRQYEELIRRQVLGVAYIIHTALIRLTLSAIFHVKRPACPYILVSREDQALAWAIKRLEAADLRAPAERIRRKVGLPSEHQAG
ncbi:hypothetical protein [Archangium sp.]|uniref:hypothetical protein n=1 Tax=Archangium sp. TaxID=1872627 RepID=UPI002D2F6F1A|nr:hypothetical protein [Archangium sp.]HYO51769.1 hypothetical protein [Archangium sp.]